MAQASGNQLWASIASSSDGTKLAAVVSGGQIYSSTDSGVTWTAQESSRSWLSIASSSDGTKLAAVVDGGQIFTSVSFVSYVVTVPNAAGAQSQSSFATNISRGPADEAVQTVAFTLTVDNSSLFSAQPALAADGTLTFTPLSNSRGTTTVSVTAQDSGLTADGGVDTSVPQTFTIIVT